MPNLKYNEKGNRFYSALDNAFLVQSIQKRVKLASQ